MVTFDEPKKVGKRTYDDGQFRDSLKTQATAGENFQLIKQALHKLIQVSSKYQIMMM